MKYRLSAFVNCNSGNMAFLSVILAIPLMIGVGGAVDFSAMMNVKSKLQEAADGAALSGAGEQASKLSTKIQVAKTSFAENYTGFGIVGTIDPDVEVDGENVKVSANYAMPTSFLSIIGLKTLPIHIDAIAAPRLGSPACIIALNEYAADSFQFAGNSNLNAINCSVQSNSRSPSALKTLGRAEVIADNFCAVGGYSGDGFSPLPNTNCKKVDDPHAALAVPASRGCIGEPALVIKDVGVVLNAGTYCGGISVLANAEVTLNPGTYVIKDGSFEANANSTINGTGGVTIYLDGSNSVLKIISGSTINITAPKTGTYAGFAVAQNRHASSGLVSKIEGGGSVNVTGCIYLPTQTLEIAGGGDVGLTSGYFAMIADKFVVRGNGRVQAKVDPSTGMPPNLMNTIKGVRLIN